MLVIIIRLLKQDICNMPKYKKHEMISIKLPAWLASKLNYLAQSRDNTLFSKYFKKIAVDREFKTDNTIRLSRREKNFLRKLQREVNTNSYSKYKKIDRKLKQLVHEDMHSQSLQIHFMVVVEYDDFKTLFRSKKVDKVRACSSEVLFSKEFARNLLFVTSLTDINDVTCMGCLSTKMPPPKTLDGTKWLTSYTLS